MAGAPPPLPSSRPKGAYVPPPLPSNRPKVAYVHPLPPSTPEPPAHQDFDMKATQRQPDVISTTGGYGSTATASAPGSLGRQLQSALQDRMMNNLNEISTKQQQQQPASSNRPQIASKPASINHSLAPPQPPQNNGAAQSRPLSFSDIFSRNTNSNPQSQTQWFTTNDTSSTNSAPNQSTGMFGTSSSHSTGSKTTVSVAPEQKAAAANYSWNVTKDVAKNVSAKDALNVGSFFASAFASDGKASASKNQQASLAKVSSQVGSSAAKNVTAEEVHHAANFAATNAVNNASPNKQPNDSHMDILAQLMGSKGGGLPPPPNAAARARPKPGQPSAGPKPNLAAGFPPPPASTPRQDDPFKAPSVHIVPPRAAPRAPPSKTSRAPAGGSLPRPHSSLIDFDASPDKSGGPPGLPKSKAQGPGGNRLKPTIIRPGAGKDSRSVSPAADQQQKKSKPPPRPSGPPMKKAAPSRPNAVAGTRSAGSTPPRPSGLKPKRKAPPRPGSQKGGRKPGPGAPPSGPKKDALPPRPGPGHPLYQKYMGSEPHGFATFDYDGQEADELSFKANDTIILVKRIDADWLIGKCNGRQGMFPTQFIKIVKDIQESTQDEYDGPQAVSVFAFEASAPDELTFKEGDVIKLLGTIGTVWFRGELNGKEGIFPSNHVEVIIPLPASPTSEAASGPRCKAKFDYSSGSADDLAFNEGDVIKLIQKINDEWYKGEVDGRTGIFPLAFVDLIEDLPASNSNRLSPTTGNEVRAVYDFDGADETELSFKDGDRILVTAQVGSEWLEGERKGQKGRFPSNFVDRVPPGLPKAADVGNVGVEPHCVVSFQFEAQGDDEIQLKAGEKVTLLERIGEDWLRGKVGAREGIFPRSFVDVIIDLPVVGGGATGSKAKALFDFDAENPDELSFKGGDIIQIAERVNDEWLQGSVGGRSGRFPSAFVELSS